MLDSLLVPILDLIASWTHYQLGSYAFYLVVGSSLVMWVVVARVFMGLLKSGRGLLMAGLSLTIPMFLGFLTYGLSVWQLVPLIGTDWAGRYLGLILGGLMALLAVLLISKRMLSLSIFNTILVFFLASLAATAAYFGAGVVLQMLGEGRGQIQQREERTKNKIESML